MKQSKILKLFLLIIILNYSSNINSLIILIHGTFAANLKWHTSEGSFYKNLKEQAEKQEQKLTSFTWSGGITDQTRIEAAGELALLLLEHIDEKEIILIGHSHGGNIISLASKLLYYKEEFPEFSYLHDIDLFSQWYHIIQTKIRELSKTKDLTKFGLEKYKQFSNSKNRKKAESKNSLINNIGNIDNTDKLQTDTDKTGSKNCSKKYFIDTVYFLATPIKEKYYAPNLKIIREVYNCYSIGDKIQTFIGFYSKTMHENAQVKNIQFIFGEQDEDNKNPGHSQMRSKIVAKWILSIPQAVKSLEDKQANNLINNSSTNNTSSSNTLCLTLFDKQEPNISLK